MCLTIDQCKDYKRWGYDQSMLKYMPVNQQGNKYYELSLKEQLAFAVERAKEVYGEDTWFIISVGFHHTINSVRDTFRARIARDDEGLNFDEPNPQQAVYKLQAYIEEVK